MSGTLKTTAVWLVFLVAACGGKTQSEPTSGKMTALEAMGLTPPDTPWADMSFADREFYMIGKINPIMKEIFEGHDLEEYAGFDCVDCHGEEMREIKFKMPAPSMYVVPPEGTPGHRGMMATFPETVKFMQETVTPAMGKLLGIENYTCAGCHPTGSARSSATPARKQRSSGKSRAY